MAYVPRQRDLEMHVASICHNTIAIRTKLTSLTTC
jgi:hypothetical protein